jgi:hypothetical protein
MPWIMIRIGASAGKPASACRICASGLSEAGAPRQSTGAAALASPSPGRGDLQKRHAVLSDRHGVPPLPQGALASGYASVGAD